MHPGDLTGNNDLGCLYKKCVFAHSPGLTRVHLFKLVSKKMILFEAAVKSQYG